MTVWFVAPAFGRYDLSAVTMKQWASLADNFPLEVVVVADDENLDIARSYGFHTVERNNDLVGARYNDGFEYAYKHGASHAADVGTRNFLHPDLLDAIPWTDGVTHTGNLYSIVDGDTISTFECQNVFGRGPMFVPRSLLEQFPRPVDEDARKLILHSICDRCKPTFRFTNVHDFQYVGFYRDGDTCLTNISDYENRWGVTHTYRRAELDEWYR